MSKLPSFDRQPRQDCRPRPPLGHFSKSGWKLGQRRNLPICLGSPHHLTLSRFCPLDMSCVRQWMERPNSSEMVSYQCALDWSNCSFVTWLWAVGLQMGHAYSITGRMICLYSKTQFLMERPLHLFKKGPKTPSLSAALLSDRHKPYR